MTSIREELAPLLSDMDNGSLVLTPNHRIYTQLLDFYGVWRESRGLPAVCRTPSVFPVDIWIRSQWQRLQSRPDADDRRILEPAHETLIWQNLVGQSDIAAGLVNKTATARSVQEAWRLTHLWNIDFSEIRKLTHYQKNASLIDDMTAFLHWVEGFEHFCNQHRLISLSPLVSVINETLQSGKINAPDDIVFVGFDNPPPLYDALLNTLAGAAKKHNRFSYSSANPTVKVLHCTDAEDEIFQAAQWARQLIQEKPNARIGIICPDLPQRIMTIQRQFRDTFRPSALTTLETDNQGAFGISGRVQLSTTPLVQNALSMLSLNTQWVDTLDFSRLLRSPYSGHASAEETPRAALEMRLRDGGELKVQTGWIRELAGREDQPYHCPALASSLLALDTIRQQKPARNSCASWSLLFEQQLDAMGWPGEREPDNDETRQMKSWSAVLREFQQSSHWYGNISLEDALSHLRTLASAESVSSHSDQAAVQVLTPTEAEGLVFSHVWMMGLSEQQWPPSVRPTPFIPLVLQKKAGVPGSDIQQLTTHAREALQHFHDYCSDEITFSYPTQQDDIALKPAAMLSAFVASAGHLSNPTRRPVVHPDAETLLEHNQTVLFSEEAAIPVSDSEELSGGVSIIANQAECPFRAFACHRLQASLLPTPAVGIAGHVVGSMLHEMLDIFWQGLKDQTRLLQTSADELDALAGRAASLAVNNKARFHRYTMTSKFIMLETMRLKNLLLEWLDEERRRGSFVVAEREYSVTWQHAQLTLNMRVDRLDKTPDGNLVVVDYKSSRGSEIKWTDARQSEPQLMLYMLASEKALAQKIDGLFIAQINVEESRYKGVSVDDDIYPKSLFSSKRNIPEDMSWKNLRHSWEASLTMLANEFLAGYAAVDPKSVNSSCTWCHLDGLCRINERIEP